ncbi:MAG: LamG-like jellyroll fold domain-containing protein [Phenylobacterium sp.]|uniref:N,N-dimethylformamidase beta subunit family domain-containing protein n=1 Tax=Phenylobacterium sp. TaxID=1871053 RepID=UPI002732F765|nr:N,N-dimethylformamidase beta subunit family domain-containing protein [Phenylobacterium sp.]MDP3749548.1 LamG-like jellyroll fold domain-containing protein [Phenylobacterium sp.]
MDVVGYVDRWSGASGDRFHFHVSAERPTYRAELVRLRHGDSHPDGPGFLAERVPSSFDGEHQGVVQPLPTGSHVRIDNLPAMEAITLSAWVWPTTPGGDGQCIFALGDPAGESALSVAFEDGQLTLEASTPAGHIRVTVPGAVEPRQWLFVAATVDHGGVRLYRHAGAFAPGVAATVTSKDSLSGWVPGPGRRLVLARRRVGPANGPCGFNGKLSAPLVFDRALSDVELDRLAADDRAISDSALGRWDFAAECGGVGVPDRSGNGLHGVAVNRPTRLVTGHRFSGRTTQPAEAPEEYNAAHFHDDDLSDADWDPSFAFIVPPELESGVYAARLTAGDKSDYVPFVVRGRPDRPRARVAVLIPTVSYMCYANSALDPSVLPPDLTPLQDTTSCPDERAYVRRHGLKSLYDKHSDGSGVCMATMLRPMPVNARPNGRSMLNGSAHQLGADLSILHFLDASGITYEVLTDHDLHQEGAAALSPFSVVLSGTHAEYWTGSMLDGLEAYQQAGGRFVYLSGNGLYWVTALSEDGALAEMRRHHGTRSWTAEPGEAHLSLTGELGGLWRHRGRAPQRYVGVGFAAQGFGAGSPYRRTPASRDPRAAFIFAGVTNEVIGDFPVLVAAHGAAGYEVDRADVDLGTPPHALVVASATGLDDSYQNAIEDTEGMTPYHGGTNCPRVRADMVFYETPRDGAVFSVGSIAWCSGLSYKGYDNDVARITENVVRAFATPGPLPGVVRPAP